jgi:hypothetical protein
MTKELLRFKLQWSMNIYGYVAINWKRHGFLMQKNIIILADGNAWFLQAHILFARRAHKKLQYTTPPFPNNCYNFDHGLRRILKFYSTK